jgi:hypothetical protein
LGEAKRDFIQQDFGVAGAAASGAATACAAARFRCGRTMKNTGQPAPLSLWAAILILMVICAAFLAIRLL